MALSSSKTAQEKVAVSGSKPLDSSSSSSKRVDLKSSQSKGRVLLNNRGNSDTLHSLQVNKKSNKKEKEKKKTVAEMNKTRQM